MVSIEHHGSLLSTGGLINKRTWLLQVRLDKSGVLTIQGERQLVNEDNKGNMKRVERSYGSFVRR